MKTLLITLLFFMTFLCQSQVKLEKHDLDNLISIAILNSDNIGANGVNYFLQIDSLRTPALNHIANALIAVGKGDSSIMSSNFLKRPANEELVLWYVIREIHYNRRNKEQKPRPDIDVANEVLAQNIDERWLLDNYYYRIHSGLATLFNSSDLRNYNIDIEKLGFKNKTEKAIFFVNMMDALINGRIMVFQYSKKNDKILEFCDKLPKFNGKDYFYYKDFDFDDFDWIGFKKVESYNTRNIGNLYNTLIAHFIATAELKDKKTAHGIFSNSILSEPQLFKYSASSKDLKMLYEKLK